MNRRDTAIALFALGASPFFAKAQSKKRTRVYRVAVLWYASEATAKPYWQAVLAGLQELGYVTGRDLEVYQRYANGNPSRLPVLTDELIALKPDVMVAGSDIGARAMKARTSTLPIVFLSAGDPVAAGLVQSLARPQTNVTGLSAAASLSGSKRVELLAETVPQMTRLVYLLDDTDPEQRRTPEPIARAAVEAKGLSFSAVGVRNKGDLHRAFAEIEKQGRGVGLLISATPLMTLLQHEIVAEVRRLRLPAISYIEGIADDGLLMSYGVDVIESFRYSATYIDRILKGAKPADLPVEQYAKYKFVVNLRTAREIGIKIPQSILLRADRVIE